MARIELILESHEPRVIMRGRGEAGATAKRGTCPIEGQARHGEGGEEKSNGHLELTRGSARASEGDWFCFAEV
jgi:hypothetical protein